MSQITLCIRTTGILRTINFITVYANNRQHFFSNGTSQWQTLENLFSPYLPTLSGYKAAAFREDIPPKDAPTTA